VQVPRTRPARQGPPPLPWCPAPPDDPPPPAALPWLAASAASQAPAPPRPRRRAPGLPWFAAPLAVLALAVVVAVVVLARSGGSTVSTPFLSYTAPAGWTADGTAAPLDFPALTGAVRGPGYACGGEPSVRGFAAAALLPVDAAGPADRAERLARWFAAAAYPAPGGGPPEVALEPPRPARVAGPDGPVDATVTEATVRTGAPAGCAPTRGTVLVLAAPAGGGAALLLVAGDGDGGPARPGPPDRAALEAVLAGARLGPG
jgi:hypothetical protein